MSQDHQNNEREPKMQTFPETDRTETRLDVMATSNHNRPIGGSTVVVKSTKDARDAAQLNEALTLLEDMDVLKNRKLSLQLIAHLAERVGYQCAGYAGRITVAELMLMSARASELAKLIDQTDHS